MSRRWTPSRITPDQRRLAFEAHAPESYKRKALIEGLDHLAAEMERKWGIERLPLLVDDRLRAAFHRQKDLLDHALQSEDLTLIDIQTGGMKRAWEALDKAAEQAGHKPLSPEVWEARLPKSGRVVSIVKTSVEAHLVASPATETWTLSEIAHLIDGMDGMVSEIKRLFPAAEITALTKKSEPVNPQPFDWSKGDDIPF